RAKEIDLWASSQHYQNLIENPKIGYNDETGKNKGKWRNW
ncbi:MAG: peptidase M48, partial [Spirulinaceae cyanobacterium]